MIYFTSYIISALLLSIAEKKKDKISKILSLIGILVLVFLASFRDTSVGGDVNFYVVPYFNRAISANSITSYFQLNISGDVLYDLLNYIVSRFTSDIFWLFFGIETIILVYVYRACLNYSEIVRPWQSMLVYYFLFYQFTLTTVRQSIALALGFYAISIIVSRRFDKSAYKSTILHLLLALGFHSSAIVLIPLLFIIMFIQKSKFKPWKTVLSVVVISISIFFVFDFLLERIVRLVSLINPKYASLSYITRSDSSASGYLTLILLACFVFFTMLLLTTKKKKSYEMYWNKFNTSILAFSIIYIISLVMINGFTYIARIVYYFQYFWIIAVPQLEIIFGKHRGNKVLGRLLVLSIIVAFWWYYFIYGGVTETYPYVLR